jgi:hypothetical protein
MVIRRRAPLLVGAAMAIAAGGCDPSGPTSGFTAFAAVIKGTVTVQTVPDPGSLTATSVSVAVYHSCSAALPPPPDALGFERMQVPNTGGPYRMLAIAHFDDTSAVCVVAYALRASFDNKRDSVFASPVILTLRSAGTLDSATIDFRLP